MRCSNLFINFFKKTNVMKNVINTIETASNLVTVNVKFIQGDAILNVANKEMNLNDIKETAESLSTRILTARANLKRYGKKIKGFNFNRKFSLQITVNDKVINLDDLFGNLDEFTTTLATTEKHFYNFASIIYDMLFMLTNGGDKLTVTQILNKENTLLLA